MKKIVLLFIMLFHLLAEDFTVGLGAYVQTQPYKDVDPIIVPSPVIFYDNGIVYARWSRFGVYFYGHKAQQNTKEASWGLSLTVQPRPNGYKTSDSPYLEGLDEKKSSLEGGIAFSMTKEESYLEAMFVTDLLDRYDSYLIKVEVGTKYQLGKINIYPSIVGIYESSKFIQYYYGITSTEAQRTSYETYQPGGGVRIAAQTYISYPITTNSSLFFNFRVDRLSNNAKNSPIVEDSLVYSGLASIIYTFK